MNDQHVERLRELAQTACGEPVEILVPLTHATGTVIRMRCGDTEIIGKVHRSRSLHDREVHAYRDWTPHLGTVVPRLLGVAPDLPGVIISATLGTPLDELHLDLSSEQAAHEEAGVLLRLLHELPVSTTADRVTRHLAERAEHWIVQAADQLGGRDTRLIRDHMRQLLALPEPRVAPCHLDFQPRNLLWHTDRHVRLIDFENSRPDLAARDLARLATRHWPQRPDLKAAFLRGYGPLSTNDIAVLEHATALEAVTNLVYGLRNGDSELVQLGHSLLDGLQSP